MICEAANSRVVAGAGPYVDARVLLPRRRSCLRSAAGIPLERAFAAAVPPASAERRGFVERRVQVAQQPRRRSRPRGCASVCAPPTSRSRRASDSSTSPSDGCRASRARSNPNSFPAKSTADRSSTRASGSSPRQLVARTLERHVARRPGRDHTDRDVVTERARAHREVGLGQLAGAAALERAAEAEGDRAVQQARPGRIDRQRQIDVTARDRVLAAERLLEQRVGIGRATARACRTRQ